MSPSENPASDLPDRAQDPEDQAPRDPDGGASRPRQAEGQEDAARDPEESEVNPMGEKDPQDNPPLPREWN